jgi:hypothetical protein
LTILQEAVRKVVNVRIDIYMDAFSIANIVIIIIGIIIPFHKGAG